MAEHKTVSFIIPTIGRESLKRAVASIETLEGDEILVIQHDPPSGGWGGPERNEGMAKAKGDYLAFLDDDDWYLPGHRIAMDRAIRENPKNYPILFRMQYPSGRIVWDQPNLRCGNVGSPMIFVPNDKDKIVPWGTRRHSDFQFINCLGPGWEERHIQWRSEIIAQVGHEDERWWKYQTNADELRVEFARYYIFAPHPEQLVSSSEVGSPQ